MLLIQFNLYSWYIVVDFSLVTPSLNIIIVNVVLNLKLIFHVQFFFSLIGQMVIWIHNLTSYVVGLSLLEIYHFVFHNQFFSWSLDLKKMDQVQNTHLVHKNCASYFIHKFKKNRYDVKKIDMMNRWWCKISSFKKK